MPGSVSIHHTAVDTVTEVLGGNTDAAADKNRQIIEDQFDIDMTVNGATNPAITKASLSVVSLVGGALTIDLTNLRGPNDAAVNGTGLKPQIVKIKNVGTSVMYFKLGAANGHNFFTADGMPVWPGGHVSSYANDGCEDIDSTHKTWDITGTGTDQVQLTVALG